MYTSETSAGGYGNTSPRSKTNWPEQSKELLGLIINSLRALDGAVPQGCSEPRRRPQSAQKIAVILDKAPNHLQRDLVSLVPKLVEQSEHPLAAQDLLERIQKPDAEPALRVPVFGALCQLELDAEVWEVVLHQSLGFLLDSNDEPLAATMDFIFKASSQCQQLPQAVRSVRCRLKDLAAHVSSYVLDFLHKAVNSWGDLAETILRDIDSDQDYGETCSALPYGLFLSGNDRQTVNTVDEQAFSSSTHFSDIYLVIEMLSIPCLAVEASQTFERAVAKEAFIAPVVAYVLERRLSQRMSLDARYVGDNIQNVDSEGESPDQSRIEPDDFASLLGLAETLTMSSDLCVQGFVKVLYASLFKWYPDESYRERMLKRLVDRATITSDGPRENDLNLDILVLLVSENQDYIRPILCLIREVAELANVDRSALWHQLCASEEEIIRLKEERINETSNLLKEKTCISQKLNEAEAASNRLKSEMKAEADRFSREKKELLDQIQDVESQLEWFRSERDDEISKLSSEKRVLQDRLHDAETQLSLLKSRKRDELKKVMKEKNALAERLKNAEAARKRFDDELKRYATENVTKEEIRQSLEDEVRRLTQTVGQTEEEKREKEEQVAQCEAYIDGMESQLQTCQQYICSLGGSLQEEMSRHAPLYGVGLESLSMKELETLMRIHEEGLRQIHAIQQRNSGPVGSPMVSQHNLPHSHGGLYPSNAPPTPTAVGLPSAVMQNGVGIHSNGHVNRPWYNHK